MATTESTAAADAVAAFSEGRPVLVYDADDREGEVDLVYPADAVTAGDVARLRNDAGGLVCVAVSDDVADAFDLPFLQEALDHDASQTGDLEYDERASFSLPVNHRDTYTGITDEDRALTITEVARAAETPDATDFAAEFRSPGHVFLLRAAPGLLEERDGHTEYGVALARAAGRAPAAVVCEMLDDETGAALSPDDAAAYADRHDLVYVTGTELKAALS